MQNASTTLLVLIGTSLIVACSVGGKTLDATLDAGPAGTGTGAPRDPRDGPPRGGTAPTPTTPGTIPPTPGGDPPAKRPDGGLAFDGGDSDAGSSTGCAPADVSSFVPQWKSPAPHTTVCSAALVESILKCIFDDTANPTTCDALLKDAANKPCQDCLLTPATDPHPGPLVVDANIATLDIGGCIALEGDATCGAKYQAAYDCASAACVDNCPGFDTASLQDLQRCETAARSGGCATYAAAAKCADAALAPDGGAAHCGEGNNFLETAIVIGKLFCAP